MSEKILSFVTKPTTALAEYQFPSAGINKQSTLILSLISRFYPITYKSLQQLRANRWDSNKEFVETLLKSLHAPEEYKHDFYRNLDSSDLQRDVTVWVNKLITIVARHEAYVGISDVLSKPGPKNGILKNKSIRSKIIDFVASKKSAGCRFTQRQIAVEMEISPQRISVLMKELRSQKKV